MLRGVVRVLCFFIIVCVSDACRRERFDDSAFVKLGFSDDTISFDTIFTTFGSITQNFRIYNRYNKSVRISSINLAGGDNSVFRLNVDGISGKSFTDVEISPDDSLYVFVETTLDPAAQNLPLLIEDSILFVINGNLQKVILEAWGQDVHLYNAHVISADETWTADKPYLIHNNCVVDTGVTLTIEAGTTIYLHRYSSIVSLGTLKINGTMEQPVKFRGDRLEPLYEDIPGQWGTIAILGTEGENTITYADIKNAIAGFQIGLYDTNVVVTTRIYNTKVYNTSGAGIYAYGANISGFNMSVFNTGSSALALLKGGNYEFYHCTMANVTAGFVSNVDQVLAITNYFKYGVYDYGTGTTEVFQVSGDLTKAFFGNCIIYGGKPDELLLAEDGTHQFNYMFDHCLMKINTDTFHVFTDKQAFFTNNIYNQNPQFNNPAKQDYSLMAGSPAINGGSGVYRVSFPELSYDIDGILRDDYPDMGAIERKEE